jgi:hypothetical protein
MTASASTAARALPAQLADALRGRWRSQWDSRRDLARLGREFRKVLRFAEEVPAKRPSLPRRASFPTKGLMRRFRRTTPQSWFRICEGLLGKRKTVTDIATRRARLGQFKFDTADVAAALLRQEMRAQLRNMSQGERVAAITQNRQFREAVFEGPGILSALSEDTRSELKRRIGLEEHPYEAAQLEEAEKAVAVANAAISMIAGALQTSGGFEAIAKRSKTR